MKFFMNVILSLILALAAFEFGWKACDVNRMKKSTVKIMLEWAYHAGIVDEMLQDIHIPRRYKDAEDYANKEMP